MAATQDKRAGKALAVCVDDFGLGEAVDGSVFALAKLERISAAACLVDAPRWAVDAPRLQAEFGARLDIGLHLNLSESFAGAAAPWAWHELVLLAHAGRLPLGQVRAAIERQLDRFEAAMGRAPDFIDGHRHVHQLPGVRTVLLRALQARGQRPWLRCTLPRHGVPQTLKATFIGLLGARLLQRDAQAAGFATNRRLLGVYGFSGSAAAHAARLAAWLAAAHDGDLLVCHSALPGPAAAGDPIAAARRAEHQLLAGDAFGRLLAQQRVRVARLAGAPDRLAP